MDRVVISKDCTLILPDLGLELGANVPTPVPFEHLSAVLAHPGVVEVTPNPDI